MNPAMTQMMHKRMHHGTGPGLPSDAPLVSPSAMASLQKSNPKAAANVKAMIASGKIPSYLPASAIQAELSKLPSDKRTQVIAALRAAGFQVSAAATKASAPGHNPFSPSYSVKELAENVPPVSSFVSFVNVSQVKPHTPVAPVIPLGPGMPVPIDVALGRVSGIILSGGVHAIYESDGNSTIIQPGDALPDGAGRVVSIDPTGIIVRISGDRYVKVAITANAPNQPQGQPSQPQGGPGQPPPGFGNEGGG